MPDERPGATEFNPWLVAVVVACGAFMEVLDTSIANVALPHIAGNIGASNDESTWVLTSYLVSNAIVLPMSGWFVRLFGRQRCFLVCLTIFTVASVMCGFAPSLGALIFWRCVQGFGGGGLQPLAQAILADLFPPEKRGMALAIYGVTVVFAPTIGPTLGGWITDNYSWRWVFFINLPVGIFTTLLAMRMVKDPPYLQEQRKQKLSVDYMGIAFLVLGVGAFQVMLDRGQEDDWFGSHFIIVMAIVAAVSLISLVIWEWRQKTPLIDVRLFKCFNFAAACLLMFCFGMILFGTLVMMPEYLQTLMGYTATNAGMVLSASGAVLILLMPVVGQLSSRVQVKYLISFGWLLLCGAMVFTVSRMDLQISFETATWVRVVQSIGFPFLFVPITLAGYVGVPAEKSGTVSGLINFMRNIGASVGTSITTTLLARRAQFHQSRFVGHTSAADPAFHNALQALARQLIHSGASAADAPMLALARLYHVTIQQATALAYIDAYKVMGIGAGIMCCLSLALRGNDLSQKQPEAGA